MNEHLPLEVGEERLIEQIRSAEQRVKEDPTLVGVSFRIESAMA